MLRWSDIDLDHEIAYIGRQIQYTDRALVLCPLKTAASLALAAGVDLQRPPGTTAGP